MKKSAFTLIELSIVLVIIGILIAGVTKGSGLITAARLANGRSITAKSPVPAIDGLVAWYEASSKNSIKDGEAFEAAQITEWRDINPGSIPNQKNKLTKSANSDLLYRISGINKLPTLEFSGTGKISIANFYQGSSAQATIFLVLKPLFSPSSSATIIFDAASGASDFSIGIKNNKVRLNAGTASESATGSNVPNFTANNDYILAAYFNGTTSGAYVNNAASPAGVSNIDSGSNSLSGVTIGTDKTGSSGFHGMIAEVIIFNRPLKLQERKDVMSYLSKKYRIGVIGI